MSGGAFSSAGAGASDPSHAATQSDAIVVYDSIQNSLNLALPTTGLSRFRVYHHALASH